MIPVRVKADIRPYEKAERLFKEAGDEARLIAARRQP